MVRSLGLLRTGLCAWLVLLAVVSAGCASKPSPGYTYNEIVIVNQTRTAVRDVAVSATESGRIFSCGNIAPRGICSNRFPPQPYRASPVRIDWRIGDGSPRNTIIELALPQKFVTEVPLRGVLVIDAEGGVSAYLQQPVPGPHL